MTDPETAIQQAASAARAGRIPEARQILAGLLRQDPRNARAWYLLSQVIDPPDRQIACLKKVLEIDPGNSKASERLNQLQAGAVPASAPPTPPTIQQPNTASPKASRTNMWLIALAGAVVLGMMCCLIVIVPGTNQVEQDVNNAILNDNTAPVDDNDDGGSFFGLGGYTVVYRIKGPGTAMITYQNGQGGFEQITSAQLPWEKKYEMEHGDMANISAQLNGTGQITCEIIVDGKTTKRSNSSGQYVIASCFDWLGMDE